MSHEIIAGDNRRHITL